MGLGTSLKKLAGSGGLGLAGKLMYKKDGSSRGNTPIEAAMNLAKDKGGSRSVSAEPQEGGQTGRPMFGGGKRGTAIPMSGKGMKAGGYVKAADGCAKKGKTKGKMV